jgi:hypothetical protein
MKIRVITSIDMAPLDRDMLELADVLEGEDYEVERFEWEEGDSDQSKALYDIYASPALLLLADNGSLIEAWQGEVPTAAEVKYRGTSA